MRLEAIGFVWSSDVEAWEKGFSKLQEFYAREGHCRVHAKHQEDGYTLGSWVSKQRIDKATLSSERMERLEATGFVWDALTEAWEQGFSKLQRFHAREGHCRVPRSHKEDGYNLGSWANKQRIAKPNLSSKRLAKLEAIGFVWDPSTKAWEEGYSKLKQFYAREGHYRVPQKHKEDGYNLGYWVSDQRKIKAKVSPERLERLEALGFVWDARGALN